jgi:GTP-binding protein HflX
MHRINGNISGIRRSYIERLESIFDMETDRREFGTAEMLEALAFFTEATGREAMVYLDRAGRILTVAVGEQDRVSLPLLKTRRSEERLSGIRCIHTHPGGNSKLSEVDIQSLKKMKFDAMAAVGVRDGKPTSMQVGILHDDELAVNLFGLFKANRIPDELLWNEIEAADNRIRAAGSKKAGAEIARAILVGIVGRDATGTPFDEPEPLKELSQLADTAGFITVGKVTQPRLKPDKSYYLGSGRLHDLVLEIQSLNADIVIFDDELSPAQIRNIQKELGKTEIMDRTSLILDIFSGRASTHEGRLQVELAETKYMLPRMTGFWTHMSRMGGGGGGGAGARRGEGETQLEVDRRILRKRLHDLEKEIDKIKSRRDIQRTARERSKIPIVAFVGYTNAGKSTLMNKLSGSNVLAEDKLFATLDPVSRRVNFGCGELLLVDTVGFINKLPHDLVDAFRATLEEAVHADLLLHVVDSSSPEAEAQMKVVGEVLVQLGAGSKPILTVYNKCDVSGSSVSERDSVCVSAKTGAGLEALKTIVTQKLAEQRTEISVMLPLGSGSLISRVYANGQVTECEYLETGIKIKAAVTIEDASRLRAEALEIYS